LNTRSADASEGVAFLTSLLVRFPELGSASLGPNKGEIRLEFYLDSEVDTMRFEEFIAKFRMSWDLFFELLRVTPNQRRISRVVEYPTEESEQDADVEIIRVTRDLETLTLEELSLMVGLIKDRFIATMIEGEAIAPAEARYQEQVLLKSLDRVRSDPHAFGSLTGFRDEMRVLVYSSDDNPSKRPTARKGQAGPSPTETRE
jgi:hypothetical protein